MFTTPSFSEKVHRTNDDRNIVLIIVFQQGVQFGKPRLVSIHIDVLVQLRIFVLQFTGHFIEQSLVIGFAPKFVHFIQIFFHV